MISIVTAIYNQYAVNKLYWEALQSNTYHPFELIVIDNGSNDGSAEFFESVGAVVIRNGANYSYPFSQNQGIKRARYDWLAFLNNDIIVSPKWDQTLIESMEHHDLSVATCSGIEQVENWNETKKLKRRWKRIKNPLSLFGCSTRVLQLMHRLMYPDWLSFCEERRVRFSKEIKEGFVGNTVMIRRDALEKIGLWDESLQAADIDLYLRTKQRALSVGDIKPVHIALDVFNHHYIRLTAKGGYPPFADRANLIDLEDKWSPAELAWLDQLNK